MIIGIDPGFTGAIATVSFHGTGKRGKRNLKVYDMPLTKVMGRKQICANTIVEIIEPLAVLVNFAVIEDVHSMPGQGVSSTFRFGYNAGILFGILSALDIKIIRVKPAVWKSALNLSSDKNKSITLAIKSFPEYAGYFNLKKHDGRAEAALLAHYGRRLL